MKHLKFFIIAAAALLTSCATSDNVINDDAYYSPYNKDGKSDKELVVSNDGSFSTSKISSNSQYDYQSYYSEDQTPKSKADPLYERTETVTDTNGVVYTSTEIYYDDNYLANNASGGGYLKKHDTIRKCYKKIFRNRAGGAVKCEFSYFAGGYGISTW